MCVQMLEDIQNGLAKLGQDKDAFVEWQKACSDAEQLGHIVSAYRCYELERAIESEGQNRQNRKEELQSIEADHKAFDVRPLLLSAVSDAATCAACHVCLGACYKAAFNVGAR